MSRMWGTRILGSLLTLVGVATASDALAVPSLITVQGALQNSGGAATDGTYTVEFQLFTAETGGTSLWTERKSVDLVNGLFDAILGDDDPILNPLDVEDFKTHTEVWLQVQMIDGPGVAQNEAPLPRKQLTSVAYSMVAQHANTATTATTASTATSATTATTAATATTAIGLVCANGCVSVTELDFDPATQAELDAVKATYVTTASLNTTLNGYVTSAALTAAVNTAVSAALSSYPTTTAMNTAIATALSTYSTTTAMNTAIASALTPYSTTTAMNTAIAGALTPYSTTTQMNTAITGALTPYSTTTQMDTAITSALSSYSTTTATNTATATAIANALASYSTTTAMNTAITGALAGYSTTTATNTAIATAITNALASYSTTTAMNSAITTALAPYAKTADLPHVPTSISELSGGTVSGDVASATKVSAPVLQQGGNPVCDSSGNCGATLGTFDPATACAANQVLQWGGGAWKCASVGGGSDPGTPCTRFDEVKYWNGTAWVCRSRNAVGDTGGIANGYLAVDAWGYAWDGVPRAKVAWAAARDACLAQGGRLPTVTELVRNNTQTGTGNLGMSQDTDDLWSLTPGYRDDYYYTTRLSDGYHTRQSLTSTFGFRCVWPNRVSTAFDGNRCFGPPGAECAEKDRVWNSDVWTRPALDVAGATFECHMVNASLPTVTDVADYVKAGQWANNRSYGDGGDGAYNDWHWMANTDYEGQHAPYSETGLYRWTEATKPEVWWGPDNGSGYGAEWTWSSKESEYWFQCVGKKSSTIGVQPDKTSFCNGGCFTTSSRRARVWMDKADRSATQWTTAAATCRAQGASLPTPAEMNDIIPQGLPAGDVSSWYWTSEPGYWYSGNYGYMLYTWAGTGQDRWIWGDDGAGNDPGAYQSGTIGTPDATYKFRCIWHETIEQTHKTCPQGQVQKWNGSAVAFTCAAAVGGDAAGQANPPGADAFVDGWGNAWDPIERGQDDYPTAKQLCASVGGDLPTVSELWRVRNGQAIVPKIDNITTNYNWSITPNYIPDQNIAIRLDNGSTNNYDTRTAPTGSKLPFRCIWRATKPDQFSGHVCYGEPSAPCFEVPGQHLRTDKYDRAPVSYASAYWECKYFGGHLPNGDEFADMVHGGAPNGSNSAIHMAEPEYWYSGAYGQNTGRWNGTGTTSWAYNSTDGNLYYEANFIGFRCVYSDNLR
ncbi:MAG: hypothetical protein U1F43_25710 [Myxococcota bacterium]